MNKNRVFSPLLLLMALMSFGVNSSDKASIEALQENVRVKQSQYDSKLKELRLIEAELEDAKKALKTATAPKRSRKIGEQVSDVPCECVFNSKRMWNPEKILWNNQYWKCSEYNDETGECLGVEVMSPEEVKKIKK
ncbi:hypothetical protein SAMN04488540_1146 [Ferrimonas sediminum]|uniref:Uncharacterized protein n=1 Tax=Ferrimonas sediminum TaxID=718193 RepID=A0A1G8WUQ3_9GAMM|nr:hypothetical protein [Ferrimonas sediminum]SDJ81941.1 hypothetical protein SAMN04488540_1146 [Ferrimonas sediminum]